MNPQNRKEGASFFTSLDQGFLLKLSPVMSTPFSDIAAMDGLDKSTEIGTKGGTDGRTE